MIKHDRPTSQGVEGLPLTKEQRGALRRLIAEFDREREEADKAKA